MLNKTITDATAFLNETNHKSEIASIMGHLYTAHRSTAGITTELLDTFSLDSCSRSTLEENLRARELLS